MTNQNKREIDKRPKADQEIPAAGPHAKREQTDKDKSPGTGMLPDEGDQVEGPTG